MKKFTLESLKDDLREIANRGWIQSHRDTSSARNDGAAGNLLENLLGIEENNFPLPDAGDWEIKVTRATSGSLVTLAHSEPWPRAMRFVPLVLLPKYGWPHAQAGVKYPITEQSFRMTMNAGNRTDRGFGVIVEPDRLRISFDSLSVAPHHEKWLSEVQRRVGNLDDFATAPFWLLEDLKRKISPKLHNTIHVVAESKVEDGQEWFRYSKAAELSGFDLQQFVWRLKEGNAYVEFDARSGHNHGTKFRITQEAFYHLYANQLTIFDLDLGIL